MKQQIKVPSVGESVTQATIGEWQKKDGEYIRQNDVLVVMETDKASMDLTAEHNGRLKILKPEGEDVKIGEVIAEVDTASRPEEDAGKSAKPQAISSFEPASKTAPAAQAKKRPADNTASAKGLNKETEDTAHFAFPSKEESAPKFPTDQKLMDELLKSPFIEKGAGKAPAPLTSGGGAEESGQTNTSPNKALSPAVRRLISEHSIPSSQIKGTGPAGRITKGNVLSFIKAGGAGKAPASSSSATPYIFPLENAESKQVRKKMSLIRKKIAERLVQSQHSTATLTTFNEVDMSEVISLRAQYKDSFQKKYNIKLGFMGFFIKAAVYALKAFPKVNAFIEGDEILYNPACHIGVAVSTERGLVVPVIRHADKMGMPEIEKAVLFYAEKARDGKIRPDDLMGGTFTISNGGVFGSLMSTPILNPPQSGILGMHRIEQRPVAVYGQVKIKPMMYVALSYDHRMVDGRESVGFLLKIKECVEDPMRLLLQL